MDESADLVTTGFYMSPGTMTAIGVVFHVLGVFAVIGRFGMRQNYGIPFMVDDWVCIPALVGMVAQGVVYICGAKRSLLGYRLSPDTTPEEVKMAVASHDPSMLRMIELACNIISALSTGLIRLSFLFFYRRIIHGKVFNVASWMLVAATTAWSVAMIITYFSICPYYLNPNIPVKLSCDKMLYFLGAYSITGFVLDLFILLLPFPWLTKARIWPLKPPGSQRWAVTSMFLCGGLTVAASCVRMVCGIEVLLEKAGQYSNIVGLRSYGDIIGGAGVWLFWSYIENGTGRVVACLPPPAPLFRERRRKHHVGPHPTVAGSTGSTRHPSSATPLSDTRSAGTTVVADQMVHAGTEKPANSTVMKTVDRGHV